MGFWTGAVVDMIWDCCLAAPSAPELEKGHQAMTGMCATKALLERLRRSDNRQESNWA